MADVSQTPLELTEEERELVEITSQYDSYPRLSKWIRLFLDPRNEETFGNRTQSAMIAYNLDPDKQYHYASELGSKNAKKCKGMILAYYERKGISTKTVLDLIATKAYKSNNPRFTEMLAELTEVKEMKPTTLVQNNIQVNAQVDAKDQVSWNDKFKEFLKNL